MSQNFDIDTEEEFAKTEEFIKLTSGGKRFVIDIDGVIVKLESNLDYAKVQPNEAMIQVINKLYDMGNEIP